MPSRLAKENVRYKSGPQLPRLESQPVLNQELSLQSPYGNGFVQSGAHLKRHIQSIKPIIMPVAEYSSKPAGTFQSTGQLIRNQGSQSCLKDLVIKPHRRVLQKKPQPFIYSGPDCSKTLQPSYNSAAALARASDVSFVSLAPYQ